MIPQTLPADSGTYSALVISLVDSNGAPTLSLTDVLVYLSSTNQSLAAVPPTVTLPAGHSYVLVSVTTGTIGGSATLTAASSGLSHVSVTVKTVVPASGAQGLGLFVSPSPTLLALEGDDLLYAVELQGASGQPAVDSVATSVVLTSSNGSMMGEPIDVSVPGGSSVAYGQVKVNASGSAVLTALGQGLKTATAQLSVSATPATVSLSVSPSEISPQSRSTVTVTVQVLGMPVPGANVTLTTNGGTVLPSIFATGPQGQGNAEYTPAAPGVFTISAVATYPVLGLNLTGSQLIVVSSATATRTGTLAMVSAIYPYLPIVVIAVVIVVVFLLVRRLIGSRKGAAEEEEGYPDSADQKTP